MKKDTKKDTKVFFKLDFNISSSSLETKSNATVKLRDRSQALVVSNRLECTADFRLEIFDVLRFSLVHEMLQMTPQPKVTSRQIGAARWPSHRAISSNPALAEILVKPQAGWTVPVRRRSVLLPDKASIVEFTDLLEDRKDGILQHLQVAGASECFVKEDWSQKSSGPDTCPNSNTLRVKWLCQDDLWIFFSVVAKVVSVHFTGEMEVCLIREHQMIEELFIVVKIVYHFL